MFDKIRYRRFEKYYNKLVASVSNASFYYGNKYLDKIIFTYYDLDYKAYENKLNKKLTEEEIRKLEHMLHNYQALNEFFRAYKATQNLKECDNYIDDNDYDYATKLCNYAIDKRNECLKHKPNTVTEPRLLNSKDNKTFPGYGLSNLIKIYENVTNISFYNSCQAKLQQIDDLIEEERQRQEQLRLEREKEVAEVRKKALEYISDARSDIYLNTEWSLNTFKAAYRLVEDYEELEDVLGRASSGIVECYLKFIADKRYSAVGSTSGQKMDLMNDVIDLCNKALDWVYYQSDKEEINRKLIEAESDFEEASEEYSNED